MDIRALTHEPLPGVRVACRMEGDAFEMEDQRNWLDASYKTYVRPLALPWPYTIAKGEKLSQRVCLVVTGAPRQAVTASADGVTVTVEDREVAQMPSLGLAVPAEHAEAALGLIEPLRALGPAHLMAAFDARKGHDAGLAQTYGELARALDAELVLEVVLPCVDADGKPTDDLGRAAARPELREGPDRARRRPPGADRGLAGLRPEMHAARQRLAEGPAWADLAAAARAAFPGIAIGGGMFSYFTELNRKRPPAGPVRLRRPHHLPAGPRRRRPLAHRGPGGAALHHRDHPIVRGDARLTGCSHRRSRCARTPTARRPPRTRTAAGSPWPAPTRASMR